MRVLPDTNVLVRSIEPGHPQQAVAVTALAKLLGRGHEVCVVPQNFYEFWSVTTRPAVQNGLGLTPAQVATESLRLKSQFTLLPDPATLLQEWERLVLQHSVLGKNAHDARFAAAVIVHGIDGILTFIGKDFARFPVTVLDPSVVAVNPP